MNEFTFKYKYGNFKYCSTKSSLQNLHENFDISFYEWVLFSQLSNKKLHLSIVIINPPFQPYVKYKSRVIMARVR